MLTLPTLVLGAYFVTVGMLSIFGIHRLTLVILYYWNRRNAAAVTAPVADADAPTVLVQLPVFNERYVVERLIDSVVALDWPRDRLVIQVLDDSTDDTVAIAKAAVDAWASKGIQITHERRADRVGFKAGALAEGLRRNDAPFIAVFDADFVVPSDFLRRVMGSLVEDDSVGMVQARWTHINRSSTLLCRAQAVLLDGHFIMEHGARSRSGRFFNFNGTAGVWRRTAIDDAGGWSHDTLVEDLDLSYRSQLAGWRFVYRQDIEVPAELPEDARAFKSQQHRWAKGSIQAARKLLPVVWKAPVDLSRKIEASFHMGNNLAYPLMVALLIVLPVALHFRVRSSLLVGLAVDLPIFVFATLNLAIFYALSEKEVGGWRAFWTRLPLVPFVLALGASLTPNNARAVTEALAGQESPFVRTPKSGGADAVRYRLPLSAQTLVEIGFGVYYTATLGYALFRGFWLAVPFVGLFALGFLQLGLGSLVKPSPAAAAPATRPAPARGESHTRPTAPTLEPPTVPPQVASSTRGTTAEAGR
ncbi:MAG: glycosyltransferase family 2 protein [Deltaproteobacteria bacterium]|nr:glycosyltransferase family 2 protein [Deltaproteobacteria bacterium]